MTARYIAKDTVAWKPSHTAIVTTNYLPRVDESDDGTWRRLVLVDFPYRYRKAGEEMKRAFDALGIRTCGAGCAAGSTSTRLSWPGWSMEQ
jgi:hypothetical protein